MVFFPKFKMVFVTIYIVTSPSCHLYLQGTGAHSESLSDQEWLDHLNHILQQKVRLTRLQ